MSGDVYWKCDVCGANRRDMSIDVHKRHYKNKINIVFSENIKHCNDQTHCIEGAKTKQLFSTSAYDGFKEVFYG